MKCPGQDSKYWKADAIFDANCPKCGKPVEFYKDDTSRKCSHCYHRFVNPQMDFGCASYCQFAEQCLGTLPDDFKGITNALLKDKVAVEMKKHFHTDFKKIRQATEVTRHAETIAREEGGNLPIILCTALLLGTTREAALVILDTVKANPTMVSEITSLLQTIEAPSGNKSSHEENIIRDALYLQKTFEGIKENNDQTETPGSTFSENLQTASAQKLADKLLKELA